MGEYHHTIDGKGRVIIPARFRDSLGDTFVATKGLDTCLFVYPMDEWQRLGDALRQLPFTKRDTRAFVRFFFSGAAECEADKQGRILLPNNLREHAELGKDAVIIGVSSRVEIWSKEAWERYNQEAAVSFEDISEHLENFEL